MVPALADRHDRGQYSDPRSPLYQSRIEAVLRGYQEWLTKSRQAVADHTLPPALPAFPEELTPPSDLQQPTALFNGMIYPVSPFGIRGALWYQGESNLGEGKLYTERMRGLIGGWRKLWDEGDFPFYYVQVSPYNYGAGAVETEPEFWAAQTAAMTVPNTGMVVTNDIGNVGDIHPKNKQEVGRRLALWALAKTYGKSGVVHEGPAYRSMHVDGNKLIISFDNVGGGLKSRDSQPLSWFEIIDADEGGFVKANAQIDGDTVVLTSPEVHKPAAVRFAWSMLAEPNLSNAEGLPANSFRAGELPKRDAMSLHVPEAKSYALVYDLDLSKLAHDIKYDVDNHAKITRPFDRIAYCLELTRADGQSQYVYTSMDAFTQDPSKIGIPTVASGGRFQQNVKNLNVYSNLPSIVVGQNLAGGNIEFWPDNYSAVNSANVPNASNEEFDFGDQPSDPRDGYGCMQVHNHDAKQTLFAINHWIIGNNADIGIGNQPKGHPDWTFANNGITYIAKRLRVLVHYKQ
jgi:sialate O-acetylesterase